ncbi:MAG TPA: HEAT repeat domain-containing protein, partial [Candidatus Wallbacteria bacterium]|nr:HEAT repeat domain-containing protein [Candidatus Wallbacteria bacterium]
MSFINVESVIEKVKSQNKSPNERREAIKLLGQSGSELAVDALVDLLPDYTLRLDIIHALGILANPKSTKYLLATMFESDTKVKIEIVKALRRIGDNKCVGTLIQLFQVEDDEQVKSAIFILITDFGSFDDVYQIIPACIQYPSPSVQMLALKYISSKNDERVTTLLYPLLFSPDDKIRTSAANILWRNEGPLLLKRLNYILLKTEDTPKKICVINIFGALGLVQNVEPLMITLLKNDEKEVKLACLDALKKIGDKRALGAIIQVIKTDDEDIKAKSIEALASFPEPKVTAALINSLKTPSDKIRAAAMGSLEKLITPADMANLKKYFTTSDDNIKLFICKSISKIKFMDDEVSNFLKEALRSENEDVLYEALNAVSILEARNLIDMLMMHFKHKSESIRVCAIKVAGHFKDKKCIDIWVSSQTNNDANNGYWIAVGPGTKKPVNQWPIDRYVAVLNKLIQNYDVWPVVFGGPEDQQTGMHIISSLFRGYNTAGIFSIPQSIAAMQKCLFYLGNDTGTMHMAVAAGIPCVAIFSAHNYPGAWEPYGDGH